MKGGDGMMNSLTNLQWFNTEGKNDRQPDRQSACECSSPDLPVSVCQSLCSSSSTWPVQKEGLSVCKSVCVFE